MWEMKTKPRPPMQPAGCWPGLPSACQMRTACGAQVSRTRIGPARSISKAQRGRFGFIGGEREVAQPDPASDRHQKEEVERTRAVRDGLFADGRQRVACESRDGGVHLKRHADLLRDAHGARHVVEGTGDAAEGIVVGGVGAVEAEATRHDTGVLERQQPVAGDQRAARRHDRTQTVCCGGADEVEDVGSRHRFASGPDDHRSTERGEGVQHAQALVGRQFVVVGAVLGTGTAVAAGQRTAARDLPRDHPGRCGGRVGGVGTVGGMRVHGRLGAISSSVK